MYRSLFPRDVFAELDRLQRDMSSAVRLLAQHPRPRPRRLPGAERRQHADVGGDLCLRPRHRPGDGRDQPRPRRAHHRRRAQGHAAAERREDHLHLNERFAGRFRRVVSLPDDIDPAAVTADYRDGVLHVSVKRRESAQPRRIEVQ